MASFGFRNLQQWRLSSSTTTLHKYPSTSGLKTRSVPHFLTLPTFQHTLLHGSTSSPLSLVRCHASNIAEKMAHREQTHVRRDREHTAQRETSSGFSSSRSADDGVGRRFGNDEGSLVVDENMEKSRGRNHGHASISVGYGNYGEVGNVGCSSVFSSKRSRDERTERKSKKSKATGVVDRRVGEIAKKTKVVTSVAEEKMEKKLKKGNVNSAEVELRIGLDMCSKRGDVMGAISLYDSAVTEGTKLGQYHYNVLLYLCSSAAVGVVQPAKSGSSSSSSSCSGGSSSSSLGKDTGELDRKEANLEVSKGLLIDSARTKGFFAPLDSGYRLPTGYDRVESCSGGLLIDGPNSFFDSLGFTAERELLKTGPHRGWTESNSLFTEEDLTAGIGDVSVNPTAGYRNKDYCNIQVSEEVKNYALTRGFEIYEKMCLEEIPLSEATLTSVARMAMSMGNGDMAFEIVKKIKALGLTLRLRSYGPALFAFCNSGSVEKAFEVERHMLESGVYPEEPELEGLLRVSVGAGRGEKVYYILQKLRTSVRQVSPNTALLIEAWFKSSVASRVGKRKWDEKVIEQTIENGGGGWHGFGWLGKGKWTVARTDVDANGICESCGEKLVTVDLDPIETESFARSVASIAGKRERNSSFQKFQKWLDYYGPFEAIVDAANVGLFSQRRFSLTKVNTIVNGIRQKLPSKKWPLIIVHNKRIYGGKMDEPTNVKLIEKWKNADAIYATPTGSNDDWYWLYAAIKCKGLIVTNDEMRDHIFQILGNEFFPKWKERHQVHFSFCDGRPKFHMPPPCSIVIQESKKGHWHIPVVVEHESDRGRNWLCVTRSETLTTKKAASILSKEMHPQPKTRSAGSDSQVTNLMKPLTSNTGTHRIHLNTHSLTRKILRGLQKTLSADEGLKHHTIVSDIEAAEKLSGCVIDFQI